MHFLRFLWAGPCWVSASCSHQLPTSHPLSWAVEVWVLGFLFQLGAQPQARCQLFLCPWFLPLVFCSHSEKRPHLSVRIE